MVLHSRSVLPFMAAIIFVSTTDAAQSQFRSHSEDRLSTYNSRLPDFRSSESHSYGYFNDSATANRFNLDRELNIDRDFTINRRLDIVPELRVEGLKR